MGERAAAWFRVFTKAQSELNEYPEVGGYCETRGYEIVKRFELRGDSAYHGKQEPELQEVLAGEQIAGGRRPVRPARPRLRHRGAGCRVARCRRAASQRGLVGTAA